MVNRYVSGIAILRNLEARRWRLVLLPNEASSKAQTFGGRRNIIPQN